MGKSELLRGFVASSLRDAPYAGMFVVMYESIKRETSEFILVLQEPGSRVAAYFLPNAYSAGIHSFSAGSAGAIATMATHPFDVIKVISFRFSLPSKFLMTLLDEDAGSFRRQIPRLCHDCHQDLEGWSLFFTSSSCVLIIRFTATWCSRFLRRRISPYV